MDSVFFSNFFDFCTRHTLLQKTDKIHDKQTKYTTHRQQIRFASELVDDFSTAINSLTRILQLHRETRGLEGGVSSLGDEGRNYGGVGEI